MPLTQLAPPYPIFTDKNGDPLDAGYLYFGAANQNPETSPIQVYWDNALTQPAAQPIRTINGYPARNGSPAAVYTNDYFSVTVRNKRNELVIYAPSGYGITPGTSASFSGQITYNEGSSGAVDRTLTSRLQDYVSVKDFGAVGDGVADDAPAIQAAIDAVAASGGGSVFIPTGTYLCQSTLINKNLVVLSGENHFTTFIKRGSSNSGAMLKSENFDVLKGTSDAFASNAPELVGFENITFLGEYQNSDRSAYLNTIGQGVEFFARKVVAKGRIFNTPGVGFYVENPGGNGPTPLRPGFSREAWVHLYIMSTQYEGMIFKGPPDVKIDWILQADAGSRIAADELNGKVFSPNYGSVNGGQTDGVVFDGKGAEVEFIHSFGNLGGGGIDWRGGRINANMLMVESCHYGGMKISGNATGVISILDVHRTGGFSGDNTADFVYSGVGSNSYGVMINACAIYRQNAANLGARNAVEVFGNFLNIGFLKIDNGSTSPAGHGLYVEDAEWLVVGAAEIGRCKGTAPDALPSSGYYRKDTVQIGSISVTANIRDCDVIFRSDGEPKSEKLDLTFFANVGQLPFAGTKRNVSNRGQRWEINGEVGGVTKSSTFRGATPAFNSASTLLQSLTIPHTLIYEPAFASAQIGGVIDTGTALTNGAIAFIQVTGADDTNIYLDVKMATANSVDSQPRVMVDASI